MPLKNYDQLNTHISNGWYVNYYGGPRYPSTPTIIDSRKMMADVQSTNNKKTRPWSDMRYEKVRAFGGPQSRTTRSSTYVWPIGGVWYDERYGEISHPYALVSTDKPAKAAEANSIALAKLLASLTEERTQWNMAITLGEARETARLLANTASRLANGYFAFRKGNISESWRILRGRRHVPVSHQFNHRMLKRRARDQNWKDDVSSAWMEYTYAWTPLLSDIDSAAKYLAEKHVRGYFPVQEVSRAHRLRYNYISSNHLNGNQYSYQVRLLDFVMSSTRYTYEVTPQWAYDGGKPSTLEELGFTDPATVAWNLLPLSFVVDWFVNVGQVLESLHEFRQWKVQRGLKSSRVSLRRTQEMTKNWTVNYSYSPPGATGHEQHGDWYMTKVWASREVQTSLPTSVPLRIKVDNPFDLKNGQMASAAVLLRYAFLQPRP